ncbi:CBO0543 family protein [Paenibacillus cremeus]|uniref:Uncharacterized protein n=1 Tax=Paenibacillus cremeus TaxID=2163881 RepID=A0A559K474_9BACL|nr:CBO0543 family protein [Paenibacillus cremeus]TVY06890.1 hypothetical protein FPZ49_26595 [Paenibacillus cremeus]
MHILIQVLLALIARRWGDWIHWRNYYPTILFLIIGDLLYNFVNYNYSLWTFHPDRIEDIIYRNHTLITLGIYLIGYPSLVLLYLGNYPETKKNKQFLYVTAWVLLFSMIEAISHFLVKGITYSNGWSYWWSLLFFIFVFIILRVHYLRPLLAWTISIVVILLWICFGVPVQTMK